MKIAFTTFACPTWSLAHIIKGASAHQYQGIEFRCDAQHGHEVEVWSSVKERKGYRKLIEKADLSTACIATSIQLTKEETVGPMLERVKLASDIGAGGIRVFCGPLPDVHTRLDDILYSMSRQLREVCDQAALLGVEVWLETYDTLAKAADMVRVLKAVDHPSLGVCYNNLHPIRAGEPLEETLSLLKGRIRHVHFHDGMKRADQVIIRPFGLGEMPVQETLDTLVRQGYAGFLSGEWFYNQFGDEVNDALEAYSAQVRILAGARGVALGMG